MKKISMDSNSILDMSTKKSMSEIIDNILTAINGKLDITSGQHTIAEASGWSLLNSAGGISLISTNDNGGSLNLSGTSADLGTRYAYITFDNASKKINCYCAGGLYVNGTKIS